METDVDPGRLFFLRIQFGHFLEQGGARPGHRSESGVVWLCRRNGRVGLRKGGQRENQAEHSEPDAGTRPRLAEDCSGGRSGRLFAEILLAPFAGCEAETFFEHGVEQAEVPVAAVVGDVDDFGVGVREQLPRALESQFNLPRPEGHAEFLAEQAAEMAFTAMKLPGQVVQRTLGKFGLGHLADQVPEMIAEFVAAVGGPAPTT